MAPRVLNPVNFVEIDGHVAGGSQHLLESGGSGDCIMEYGPTCYIDRGESSWGEFFSDVLGLADIAACSEGSGWSCAWAAIGALPPGKALRLARIGVRSADELRNANRLIQAAYRERASSKALRKNLDAVGEGGYAHHLVAWGDKRAAVAKGILLAHGIGPNGAINGVIVQKAGNHPTAYYNAVNSRLRDAVQSVAGQGWYAQRKAILRELADIKRDVTRGKLKT